MVVTTRGKARHFGVKELPTVPAGAIPFALGAAVGIAAGTVAGVILGHEIGRAVSGITGVIDRRPSRDDEPRFDLLLQ
jgi:hypothetical protein